MGYSRQQRRKLAHAAGELPAARRVSPQELRHYRVDYRHPLSDVAQVLHFNTTGDLQAVRADIAAKSRQTGASIVGVKRFPVKRFTKVSKQVSLRGGR
jgi:hypothetical protein